MQMQISVHWWSVLFGVYGGDSERCNTLTNHLIFFLHYSMPCCILISLLGAGYVAVKRRINESIA
jgi:hypothetical protein